MAKDFTPSSRNREAFEAMTDTVGNVPPQAVELEEAVLGALMLEKDCIITVQEFVSPEAFYTEEHRLIYKAINELSMELKPIDLYTVTERLKAKKELKKVGGASYLAQLTQKVGSAANVEFHAKIIAQKYVQRELIRSATEIQKRSYDESTDVTELIGYAEGEIFKVAEGHVKRSVQSSKDILARALMQIEEASKNTSAFSGVPSGFMALDRVTLGWQLSDLIIVAARPSMGKTAFVLSMARNMAVDHEQGVAFFSLEMSSVQLMMRLIIAETGLSGNDVKSGRLTPEQWRHLESATKPLGAAPLFIDDTPALSEADAGVAINSGAAIARDVFGVEDAVYDAILYHTTGKPDMTRLEKIIYLADYIEPTRDFPGVDELRKTVYEDLDKGLLMGLTMTIQEMEEMGNPVHHLTRDARDYLLKRGIR
mgnify:CR=1 FL=1